VLITNSNSNHQSDVPKHFVLACRTDLCEKWEGALQNFVDKKIWAHMGTSEGFDYLPVPWHVLVCEPSLNAFHIRFITFQSWFRPAGEGNRELSAAWSCLHWQTSVKVQRKSIDSKILDNLDSGSLESL